MDQKSSILLYFIFFLICTPLVSAQTVPHSSSELRYMEMPEVKHVCILDHTDLNANMTIKSELETLGMLKATASVNFEVDYKVTQNNSCENTAWPNDALAAFQHAMDIWAVHLNSNVSIRIEANWVELEERTLGSAGPTQIVQLSGVGEPNTWYTIAQLSAMSDRDLIEEGIITSDGETEEYDIRVNMNCDFDNWYFGTDGNPPPNTIDLTTVVLHEIGHGIGFFGSVTAIEDPENEDEYLENGQWGQGANTNPFIYDRFATDGDENEILDESIYSNPSRQIWEALTGQVGGMFFHGEGTEMSLANAETSQAKLYTPDEFSQGSSYSHVDQETFSFTPNALMRPRLDRALAVHSPGPLFCGMLSDMGWPMGAGCLSFLAADAIVLVDVDDLDFGVINNGETTQLTLALSNDVEATEVLSGNLSVDGDHFSIQGDGSVSLSPGNTLSVDIQYTPQGEGRHQATLLINHNARNVPSPIEISLEGEALGENMIVKLEQSYPNPTVGASGKPIIPYAISEDMDVSLSIYSIDGRLVQNLVNMRQSAGRYEVDVDMSGLSGGIYIYRVVVGSESQSGKLMHVN